MARTPVLAICGSLRAESLNRYLLLAFAASAPDLRFVGSEVIPELPLFNPDLVGARVPSAVRELRMLAAASEGAVIVSPEYVHGPSGVTTNALDWLGDSVGVRGKPVLLASASPGSTGGLGGLAALVPTLQLLGAELLDPLTVSRAGDAAPPARCGDGCRSRHPHPDRDRRTRGRYNVTCDAIVVTLPRRLIAVGGVSVVPAAT